MDYSIHFETACICVKLRMKITQINCMVISIKPATACVQLALLVPAVNSVALNTTSAERVKKNIEMAQMNIPVEFWETIVAKRLIESDFLNKLN